MLARYHELPTHLQERAQQSALNYVWDHYRLSDLMDDPLLNPTQAAQTMDAQYVPLVKELLRTKYFDAHGLLCTDVARIKVHEEQLRDQARSARVSAHLERALATHQSKSALPAKAARPMGRAL